MISLLPLASIPNVDVDNLLDLAFGSDRRQRTAYRLRDGVGEIAALSFAAVDGGELVGTIQCWPIRLIVPDGSDNPLILVGPVAVHPDRQRSGIGRRLMEAVLAKADDDDSAPMMLIGDAIYYDRFFGFSAQHTGGWEVPGPVDRERLLARIRPGHSVAAQGRLAPALPSTPPSPL